MSDALWAARQGDALMHSSMMADILGGVLEVAAYGVIGAVATAAVVAATGITVATGGLGACVFGAVMGAAVGMGMSATGLDKGLTNLCDGIANALFPPVVEANILTGSGNVFINGKPAARAAGKLGSAAEAAGTDLSQAEPEPEPEEGSFLDMAKGFFSQLWQPTVAMASPLAVPCPDDMIACMKHPPGAPQFLAEGSSKVSINGQPAVRSGDRSTCEATVVGAGLISSNVRIGGGSVVVRDIRSGKTPGVGLAISVLLALRGGKGKFFSRLPCMALGMVRGFMVDQAIGAAANAIIGSPHPVHAATGAKVLNGDDDTDFVLPGIIPLEWRRFYSSADLRQDGLFGAGWSLAFEVQVEVLAHPDGGDQLVYTDEQGRRIEMGAIPLGGAVFSAGEGLSLRRHASGQLLIESVDGLYRLFEPVAGSRLRLAQLGDRNDNRLYLSYDDRGRLARLHDGLEVVQAELLYDPVWPRRVAAVDRVYPDQSRERLAQYRYDQAGDLAAVSDAEGRTVRQFAYDAGRRMVEHQLPAGLRCFYEWAPFADGDWRVVRSWTDDGEHYQFDYDLGQGLTRITDSLGRSSTRQWNPQFQIIRATDTLGHTWHFNWNDERQLLGAVDPKGGEWAFAYDDSGNLASSTDALGQTQSTVWLEHWSLPLAETDAAGNSWRYRYDPRGNLSAETDPLGHVTRYRHDRRGQVVEIVDATGKSKRLRWNDAGQITQHIDCSSYPTEFSYDKRGNLQAVTDALGESSLYHHDAMGRLVRSELPDGRSEQFLRDASGQLLAYTDPAGHTTRYQRDRRGQVRQRLDPLNRQVQFSYDPYGRLQALTNENGESYRFTWDAGDRLIEQQDLDGSARRYGYDALNSVIAVQYRPAPTEWGDATPLLHWLQRDAIGQLRAKLTDDGRTTYRYDPVGQLTEVGFSGRDGSEQALSFGYDALGHLLQDTSSAGVLQHHYDELGNLIQTQLPDGRWLNRLHYGSGHLHQLNLDGRVISDFERDRLHREVLRTQGQLNTRSDYDRAGRLRSRLRRPNSQPAVLPAPAQQRFDYDPSDNLVGRFNQQDDERRRDLLHYDATGRIIAAQQGMRLETFAYDAAANLLDGPAAGAGLVVHNKLLTYQDKRYRYDGFGRLLEKRKGSHLIQRFTYDAEHRITAIHTQDGHRQTVLHMTYDPLGRRIAKREHDANGFPLGETRFDWDGLRLLQEHRHGHSSLYVYASEGSYEPLARVDGSGAEARIRYYHNDLNGLPEQLTETDGHTVWRAQYQVWGNTVEEVREPYYIEEQNLRFQGQYLDRETGLHYNTFRFYDPDVGRFVSPDPIGLAGGTNLYQYAPNPIEWLDPLGLSCNTDARKLASNLGAKPMGGGQYDAHHIVMSNSKDHRMVVLRAQMEDLKIDINDKRNGIWLPNTHADRAPGSIETLHKGQGVHGISYKQHVFDTLSTATTKKDFLSALGTLKSELSAGKIFPLRR
ncbi:RHS repeat-associated core domain-containing protein [Pseudomonas sp. App30]|uniref:RHS repeat-associated core domain-containing protein n=1 Tax=Pseudomonas sp. App30 TaxID=3068990 RepID=UPI003A7FBC4D